MKKRVGILLLAVGMLLAGCGKAESTEHLEIDVTESENIDESESNIERDSFSFSEFENLEFYFASGAGGWRTFLNIEEDGRFFGEYSDSDMGDIGEGYPNGTLYYCLFEGKFTQPVKVNDYTYSMKIKEISCEKETGTEEIVEETLVCYSKPYGLDGAEEVLIYLPGAPTAELPEEYMNWVRNSMVDPNTSELPFYGLYNVTEQNGFSGHTISWSIDDMMASTEELASNISTSLENDSLTQADMNMMSMELYQAWDGALNTLWAELKDNLSEEEFSVLLEEQRAWIAEKEIAVEEAGKEVEGGSMHPLVVNMKAAEITEERVYELYKMLK